MKLEHEFRVPVPITQAWDVLLDVERIAPCMPGATVESFDGETVHGRVKVKVGPIQVTYGGTMKFVEKDDATHQVTMEASGKEARGSGTASHDRRRDAGAGRGDEGLGQYGPRHHRQAGPVRPRRDGRGRQQADRAVCRLPRRRDRHRVLGRCGWIGRPGARRTGPAGPVWSRRADHCGGGRGRRVRQSRWRCGRCAPSRAHRGGAARLPSQAQPMAVRPARLPVTGRRARCLPLPPALPRWRMSPMVPVRGLRATGTATGVAAGTPATGWVLSAP